MTLSIRWKHSIILLAISVTGITAWLCGYHHGKLSAAIVDKQPLTNIIKDFAPALNVIVGLAGIILVVHQIHRIVKNAKLLHEWNVRKATIDAIGGHKRLKDEYTKIGEAIKGEGGLSKAVYSAEKFAGTDFNIHLAEVLNYFEGIAAGIKHGIYDDIIAFDSIRGMVLRVFEYAKPYVEQKRLQVNNKRAYEMLEGLYVKWKERTLTINNAIEEAQKIPGSPSLGDQY